MPLSSQLVTGGSHETGPKGGSPYHLRGQNPAVSYRPPTPPPHLISIGEIRCLSSWPGPGFMEPMFPSAPTPPPSPSMPMEESHARPSSKPKAKKKKKAAKKARPKARKKPAKKAKKKKAGKKKRRR